MYMRRIVGIGRSVLDAVEEEECLGFPQLHRVVKRAAVAGTGRTTLPANLLLSDIKVGPVSPRTFIACLLAHHIEIIFNPIHNSRRRFASLHLLVRIEQRHNVSEQLR